MANTLASGRILMRICPMWLHEWVSLCKTAVNSWLDDRAPTMGASIAYYTVFSLAPMLIMVIAIAGLAFGQKAAEGALFDELADLVGPESAGAVQAMLRGASATRSGILATVVGIGTLMIGATAVFTELQAALNVIWKAPEKSGWCKSLPKGMGQGIAIANWGMNGKPEAGTTVSVVATVEVTKSGILKVHQLDAAFDCGRIVNRDAVLNLVQGGVIFGLNMALNEEVNIKDGRMVEGN